MARSDPHALAGFPADDTSFVGRRRELAEGKRLLATARLVTLTGPAGVGKSRLAVRLARQVAHSYRDGVFLTPLAGLQDSTLVPHAVADALGIRHEGSDRPPLPVIAGHLRSRRLLLVLDNCEHLVDGCAALVKVVLSSAEGVQVLATSQHRLGVPGEHLLDVPPLPVPDPHAPIPTQAAEEYPAVRLFADRAAAAAPGFRVTAANRAAVTHLCHQLDGLPLAIELAAARVRHRGVERMEPPRHRTLRAAVDWSHDLCTPQERLAWARLAVFAGSFDLTAAETVCAGADLDPLEVLDTVACLVDKSILAREGSGDTARYRLLTLLRQYGLEKLDGLGETADTRRRHRDHFLGLVEACERDWFGPDQSDIVARLRAERENLRAALEFCLTTPGEERHGLDLLGTLWFYWAASGQWAEARHWWRRVTGQESSRPTPSLTKTQWITPMMSLIRSRFIALLVTGAPPAPTGRPPDLTRLPGLTDVVPVAPHVLAFHVLSRVEMACTLTFSGRAELAIPLCADAVAVCEAHGDQWARSFALRTLALARWTLGDHKQAVVSAQRCLRLEYLLQEPHAVGWTLELLAAIASDQGEAERAAVLQGAASRIWYDVGDDPFAGHTRSGRERVGERRARTALGERGYMRAHQRGWELPTGEAVAYALGEPAAAEAPPRVPAGPIRAPAGATRSTTGPAPLTRREHQVAELIAKGMTNRQIAQALVISQRTAEAHVDHILAKLSFNTRSQVAAWVIQQRSL